MKTTTFDTFEAFLERVKRPGTPDNPTYSMLFDKSWYKSDSYEHALELAEKGWPEGLQRMQALRAGLLSHRGGKEARFVNAFTEAGDEPDIGRYLSGEPENMIHYETQYVPSAGRVLRIVVSAAHSSAIKESMIFNKGAAAVTLIDMVENAGLRTEVWVVAGVRSKSNADVETAVWVCLKQPDQPPELDRLAFILAHPSFMRRLCFRLFEQKSRTDFLREHGTESNYGYPVDVKVEPEDIYIGAMQHGFGNQINTEADCIKFVNETLARYTEPERTT